MMPLRIRKVVLWIGLTVFELYFGSSTAESFVTNAFIPNASVTGYSMLQSRKISRVLIRNIQAKPYLTSKNSHFGAKIEGMSATPSGKMYAVDYGNSSTTQQLGQVFPQQKLFFKDPLITTLFNGLHFSNEATAFAVDQHNTRLLKLEVCPETGQVIKSSVYCSDSTMVPPNDLAISFKSGLIFLSAMNFPSTSTNTDGEIWVCIPRAGGGANAKRLEVMGRVNGIDLSPDEKTLYATESYSRNSIPVGQKIWQYNVDVQTGRIWNKRIFVDMANVRGDPFNTDLDGIKTDVKGNLLAVRHGGSQVAVFSKKGILISRIRLINILNPTNLDLDKLDRNVLFICGQCIGSDKGCVDTVHWPWAGRSWLAYLKQQIS